MEKTPEKNSAETTCATLPSMEKKPTNQEQTIKEIKNNRKKKNYKPQDFASYSVMITETEISETTKKVETKQQPNRVLKGDSRKTTNKVAPTKSVIYFNGKFDKQDENTAGSPKSC